MKKTKLAPQQILGCIDLSGYEITWVAEKVEGNLLKCKRRRPDGFEFDSDIDHRDLNSCCFTPKP